MSQAASLMQPRQKINVSHPLPHMSWWSYIWSQNCCDAECECDLEVKCEECQESSEKLTQFKQIIQKLPQPEADDWFAWIVARFRRSSGNAAAAMDAFDADDFGTLRKLYGMDKSPDDAEECTQLICLLFQI